MAKRSSIKKADMDMAYNIRRMEIMRLRRNAKTRIKASESEGWRNLLSQVDMSIPMSLKEFKKLDNVSKQKTLGEIQTRAKEFRETMSKKTASLRGVKQMAKDIIEGRDISSVKVEGLRLNDAIKVIQTSINENIAGWQKHDEVKNLIDEIDDDTTLTEEDKKYLRKWIKEKLKGEVFDYGAVYTYTIEELKKKKDSIVEELRKANMSVNSVPQESITIRLDDEGIM